MSSKRALVLLAALCVSAVLMVVLIWGLQHAALINPNILGRPAPQLAIQSQSGEQVNVWDYQGQPLVLNFWASWCAPCVSEASVFAGAASARPAVAFVGADIEDTTTGFQSFELLHPHAYPVGPIVLGSYQSYGVAALPETYFINGDGIVVASFAGPLDAPTLDHYLGLIT